MGPDAMILVFWMLSFKPTFSLSFFTFIKRLFNSSSLSAIRVVSSAYLRLLIFLPAILIPACDSSSPAFLGECNPSRRDKMCRAGNENSSYEMVRKTLWFSKSLKVNRESESYKVILVLVHRELCSFLIWQITGHRQSAFKSWNIKQQSFILDCININRVGKVIIFWLSTRYRQVKYMCKSLNANNGKVSSFMLQPVL